MNSERVVGMILGGAVGDGWGRPYEGSALQSPARVPDELVVTDDTQLTLATCEAVLECGRVDPERIAARLLLWYRAGRLRGLGASTLKALRDLDSGAHWALSGAKGEWSAGSGAAMRAAPLAMFLDPLNELARKILRDVCRITHHHDEAYVGALAVVVAVRLSMQPDYDCLGILGDIAEQLPDSQVRDRIARFTTLPDDVTPRQIAETWGSSGFVADSVPIALYAARDSRRRSFPDILQRAIEAGGDSDTIGSITGQIAGAALGSEAIPRDLLAKLRDREAITTTAEGLAKAAGAS